LRRALDLLAQHLAALAGEMAPDLVERTEIGRWTGVDDRGLPVALDDGHVEVQREPLIPVEHPEHLGSRHVALAHLQHAHAVAHGMTSCSGLWALGLRPGLWALGLRPGLWALGLRPGLG